MNSFTKPTSRNLKRLITCALFTLGTLLFSSCSKDPAPVQEISFLNITNASPTLASYNVYVNSVQKNPAALGFGGNVTYGQYLPGTVNVKFTTTSNAESVFNKDVTLEANTAHSLFLIGKSGQLDYLVTKDELGSIASDKAFIRFINLSPDAPALDLAVKDGATLIADKAYKASSTFTETEAKTYIFVIKDKATGAVKKELASTEFKAGRSYTIIASGLLVPSDIEQAFTGQIITNQ